jgi:hypothetical protein
MATKKKGEKGNEGVNEENWMELRTKQRGAGEGHLR